MNATETLQVIQALRSAGASHFKSSDFEVTFSTSSSTVQFTPTINTPSGYVAPPPQPQPENAQATEKLKDLINTLQMPDEKLIDKIFPAGAGG